MNNVVCGVAVAKKTLHFLLGHVELLDETALPVLVGNADALFDDVGAELLLRELHDAAKKGVAQRSGVLVHAVVQDVLHHVVAKLVLHQIEGLRDDLVHQSLLLGAVRVVDAALQHAAAVAMASDGQRIQPNRLEDEVGIRRAEVVEALLDYVVAVEVLDEADNVPRQRFDDCLAPVCSGPWTASIIFWRARVPCWFLAIWIMNGAALLDVEHRALARWGAMLKELLAEIVAERILHQLDDVVLDFGQDDGHVLLAVLVTIFFCRKRHPCLVLGHGEDLAPQRVEVGVGKAIVVASAL